MLAGELRIGGDLAIAVSAVAGAAHLFGSLFRLGHIGLGGGLVLGLSRSGGQKQRKQKGTLDHDVLGSQECGCLKPVILY